jgi:hypothetical protein
MRLGAAELLRRGRACRKDLRCAAALAGPQVRRISINGRADGTTQLGAITDSEQVAGMVRMLLARPVDSPSSRPASSPCT